MHKVSPPQPKKKPEKPSKDYFLLGMTIFAFVILVMNWANFDILNRVTYISLIISLGTIYLGKHGKFEEKVKTWVDRLSIASISISVVLFGLICYNQFTQ